jgi:hypothetical protein
MKASSSQTLTRLSVLSITATTVATSVHHFYRLGFEVLLPALVVIALPLVLMWWLRSSGSRVALWSYAVVNGLVFFWFGFIDGFLDHVLKALGLQNTTFLPGSEAEVVQTVFSLWSPQAGHVFYEGTGVLTAVAGFVAVYFCYRLVRHSHLATSS